MYKYIVAIVSIALLWGCSKKECDQEFFFINLPVSHTLESETIQKGRSFSILMDYPDTLLAFTGIIISEEVLEPVSGTPNQDSMRAIINTRDSINLIDIKTYQFFTSIVFQRLLDTVSDISNHPRDMNSFDINIITGTPETSRFADLEEGFTFAAERNNSRSKLELQITPKDTGAFYLSMFHSNAGLFEDIIVADGCDDLIQATYTNVDSVNADVMYAATDSLHISMFDLENLVEGRAALFFNVEE